jgi:hypothetical protein
VYLKTLTDLLEKLRVRYEQSLKERIEFEKNESQNSLIINIRNERLKINQGLDSTVSVLIQQEIDKVLIVQTALKNAFRENQFRLR